MDQSLRGFLSDLEQTGDLHHVNKSVDHRFELGAVLALRGRGAAQYFDRVTGFSMPVIGNILNSRARIARGLGVSLSELQPTLLRALDQGIEPIVVSDGPVQEVVREPVGDLTAWLPAPSWFEQERGPYITAGVIIARDPETGRRNASIARLRLEGGDRLMAGIAPTHHLGALIRNARNRGQTLEIAVAIGNHPAVMIASQMYVEIGHDELEIAGGLLNEPLRLLKCRTVDLEVPAEAEIVIEGELYPDEAIEEGPVSEFHGFYMNYGPGQAVRVKAVTHRKDPIFQTIAPGFVSEHLLLGGEAIGATTCRALKKVMPHVKQVLITEGGMGRLHAIITLHEPASGDGKRAIMLAMGHTNLLKWIVVVDDDIDPADPIQVEWAMASRMRGHEDILIVPGAKADRCDPQQADRTVTKVGIVAATKPRDRMAGMRLELCRPPKDVWDRVNRELDSY